MLISISFFYCFVLFKSHGREKVEGNKYDFSKGSFYANPLSENLLQTMLDRRSCVSALTKGNQDMDKMEELLDWDESLQSIQTDDELRALAKSNPAFFAPNIWPSNHLPELEPAFLEAGQLLHEVGILVARCCDSYVAKCCPGYEPNKLEKILRHSKCCKARLLHYFATEDNTNDDNGSPDDSQFSTWCGWHNDHGSLTGLLPALYIDNNGLIVDSPDPKAGLYIKSRNGALVHAKIPENAIAFQVGETMQIHSGGWLQATPHAVRGCKGGNVSRETFAVFMEPEYHSSMTLPEGRTLEHTQCIDAERWLPRNVRTLRSRWKLGMNVSAKPASLVHRFNPLAYSASSNSYSSVNSQIVRLLPFIDQMIRIRGDGNAIRTAISFITKNKAAPPMLFAVYVTETINRSSNC